jgi:hypothetical protein
MPCPLTFPQQVFLNFARCSFWQVAELYRTWHLEVRYPVSTERDQSTNPIRQTWNIRKPTTINQLGIGSSGRDTEQAMLSHAHINNQFSVCDSVFGGNYVSTLIGGSHRFHIN